MSAIFEYGVCRRQFSGKALFQVQQVLGGPCEILSFVLLSGIVDRSHNTYEHQNAGRPGQKENAAMRLKVFVLPI